MNMLSKICTVLMLTGAVSLMAADGDATGTKTIPSGGKGGPRGERGPRGGHGDPGGGNFSFMFCPNCHHRLIVLAPDGHGGRGGHGGREGREGGERGPRGGRRGPGSGRKGAPPQKPQTEEK